MKHDKPVVGQTLYSLNVGNAARRGKAPVLSECVVTKVGRLYFTAGDLKYKDCPHMHIQYSINGWGQKSEFSATSMLFETEQDYLDIAEIEKISKRINGAFFYGRNSQGLSLEDLRTINDIIEANKE